MLTKAQFIALYKQRTPIAGPYLSSRFVNQEPEIHFTVPYQGDDFNPAYKKVKNVWVEQARPHPPTVIDHTKFFVQDAEGKYEFNDEYGEELETLTFDQMVALGEIYGKPPKDPAWLAMIERDFGPSASALYDELKQEKQFASMSPKDYYRWINQFITTMYDHIEVITTFSGYDTVIRETSKPHYLKNVPDSSVLWNRHIYCGATIEQLNVWRFSDIKRRKYRTSLELAQGLGEAYARYQALLAKYAAGAIGQYKIADIAREEGFASLSYAINPDVPRVRAIPAFLSKRVSARVPQSKNSDDAASKRTSAVLPAPAQVKNTDVVVSKQAPVVASAPASVSALAQTKNINFVVKKPKLDRATMFNALSSFVLPALGVGLGLKGGRVHFIKYIGHLVPKTLVGMMLISGTIGLVLFGAAVQFFKWRTAHQKVRPLVAKHDSKHSVDQAPLQFAPQVAHKPASPALSAPMIKITPPSPAVALKTLPEKSSAISTPPAKSNAASTSSTLKPAAAKRSKFRLLF